MTTVPRMGRRSISFRIATGEDDDPPPAEGTLHHVTDAVGERRQRHALLLVHLLRRGLLDVRARGLHLDDVRAQLGGDLRRIGDDIDRRLALFGYPRSA